MSWLLARKGKRKKTTRRKPAAASRPWDPMRTLAAVKLLLLVGAAVGAGYGWKFGREALLHYTQKRQPLAVQPSDVILARAPGWMNDDLRLRLQGLVAAEVYGQPLDGAVLGRAVGALRHSAWVETVKKIERTGPAKIVVQADYRRPVAMVEGRDGYHPVDAKGVLLPGLYGRGEWRSLGLPLIVGERSAPGHVGEPWPGEDLRGGLALVKTLADTRLLEAVQAIDVGKRDQRGRVCLLLWTGESRDLERSPHVVWGLSPGSEQPYEPAATAKIRRLASVVRQHLAGEKIVDISGAAVWQREPLGGDMIGEAEYTARW